MCIGTGQIGQVRGDADIDRGNVVGQGRARRQMDQPRLWIKPGCGVEDQPRAGKAGKADKVDHQIVAIIVSGDVSGQHAGIRRDRPRVDDRQPCAGQGGHCPHSEDQCMGMAAADKNKVTDEGQGGGDHWEPGFDMHCGGDPTRWHAERRGREGRCGGWLACRARGEWPKKPGGDVRAQPCPKDRAVALACELAHLKPRKWEKFQGFYVHLCTAGWHGGHGPMSRAFP
jgi:hypothetical protein